jgi:hypothetical protein
VGNRHADLNARLANESKKRQTAAFSTLSPLCCHTALSL